MTTKETPAAAAAKEADKAKDDKSSKPTGKEHWGEGGEFRIDANGKRVRKPVPKSEKE